MSKKNLSLLMDGFMGEAIPSDPVQEQPEEQAVEQDAEQAEQPAAQTDKQDSPKEAPAKASSKKETTETAATEQMKSKLEAKRRENVGRPKKGEAAKSAKKPQDASYMNLIDALDEMQICNIGKYVITDIAEADRFLIKNFDSKGELSQNIADK